MDSGRQLKEIDGTLQLLLVILVVLALAGIATCGHVEDISESLEAIAAQENKPKEGGE